MQLSLFIVAIMIMLLLACGIIFFVMMYQRRVIHHQQEIKMINDRKQLELIQASIQGEEEERMRIAAELHDDVGATLSSIRLFLHSAAKKNADPDIIYQSRKLLDDSIGKIRNISHKLQPVLLQQLGLQASLESFASMINSADTLKMVYVCPLKLLRFDEKIELSIYRIIQELTTNIIRHARADTLRIETLFNATFLEIRVVHSGSGLTEEMYQSFIYKKGAIGLKNIVNRLKTINASISFSRDSEGLFNIIITTPTVG